MMRYRPIRSVTAFHLAVAATLAATAVPALAQETVYRVDPLAMTGESAPGTEALDFGCFEYLSNNLGDSGIGSLVASTEPCDSQTWFFDTDHGIWVGTPTGLVLVARRGDAAPGGTAQTFTQLSGAFVNSSGDLAIQANLDTISSGYGTDMGVWVRSAETLSLLAKSGDPAPGTAGLAFLSVWAIGLDDLGITTLAGYAGDSSNPLTGVWKGQPGSLQPIALSGDPAPATASRTFDWIDWPMSTSSDYMAFWATTDDPDPGRAQGVWKAGPAGVELVALLGNEAPGTGGRVFRAFNGWGLTPDPVMDDPMLDPYRFDAIVVNQAGDVAFTAYIDPIDPADAYSDGGLWIRHADGLTSLVALTDTIAPGTSAERFLYFNHLNLNASGQVAFDASLDIADASRDHGIWVGLPGSLNLVAREGDPAPGTAGETFDSLVMGPSLNDSGEVAFFAKLRESGTYGLWAAAADGSLSLIARVGDNVEVRSADYRTIEMISPVYGGLGSYAFLGVFNAAGQMMAVATFTDGTDAVLLASPVLTSPNQPPVANAGPDQTVAENNVTMLDGSMSSDPDGTVLSFSWSLSGTAIGTDPKVSAGPLAVGVHTVTLTVTDRSGASSSDQLILTVEPNLPPVADAGPDQTVNYTQSILLDGTGSSDPEGGALSYYWDFGCWSTAGGSGGSTNSCLTATGPSPTIWPPGITVFTGVLTVTDMHGATGTDEITITVVNDPPVANAGTDQTVLTLETVALDGSASFDPEIRPISYAWSLGGVQIATGPTPVVGPLEAGIHTITLTVTDELGASATDEVVVTVLNRAPVANAGTDQAVNHAQTVTLDAAGSSDPEGGVLSYAWTLNGTQIATGPNPVVGPFAVGAYTIALTVTDDHGATATDSMIVTVINEAPVANAGPDQTVGVKGKSTTVTLDGTASGDPEGGTLTFLWTKDGQAVGTGAVLQTNVSAGSHSFMLTVTDDHGATASDTVVVTAVKGNV